MSCTFQGGFFWAIPVFLFDIGLLWSRLSPLKRREGFPSWSWLGWAGSVELAFGYMEAWQPVVERPALVDVEVSPLFNWYVADEERDAQVLIDNSYHRYKLAASEPELELPPGWAATYDEEHERQAFTHASLPEQTFCFPFPVFPPAAEIGISSLLLKFSSQSCTMSLGAAFAEQRLWLTRLMVDVVDSTGLWAGVVESSFMEEDECIYEPSCELVAISYGCALWKGKVGDEYYQAFVEMLRGPELSGIDKYEFYNVLWIERKQGVAYRKAIGRIWAPAWNRQDLRDVEILVG